MSQSESSRAVPREREPYSYTSAEGSTSSTLAFIFSLIVVSVISLVVLVGSVVYCLFLARMLLVAVDNHFGVATDFALIFSRYDTSNCLFSLWAFDTRITAVIWIV